MKEFDRGDPGHRLALVSAGKITSRVGIRGFLVLTNAAPV
jgi:hypothetical protein